MFLLPQPKGGAGRATSRPGSVDGAGNPAIIRCVITFSLQSGSNGNAIFVEANGVSLLFDAGITGVQAQRRMAAHGREIKEVDALIISHNHGDHVRYAGVYQRKFGIPIYMTRKTEDAIWDNLGRLSDVRYFESGQTLAFPPLQVHTIPTPHDASDGVAFVIESEENRLGILTDLGHVFDGLVDILTEVDAAYLESNYDEVMLENGSYPLPLRQRIRGAGGHISNADAAALLKSCGSRKPNWVALAHLSQDNNSPDLALQTMAAAVGGDYPVYLAPRYQVSDCWHVDTTDVVPAQNMP
ncbi:MAG: MBL fold metallo-hydrolase [Planctomycetota bacterium]|jgi:phosphoribosyl 1,2-cyclic phosphodiesterase